MVGAIVSTSSIADTQHPTPRFCINPPNCGDSYRFCFRARGGEVGFWRSLQGRRQLKLGSRAANGVSRKRQKVRKFVVFGELKGQTDDSFNDVKEEIVNVMTYKAVRTVLHQLYELNPPQYTWFYNFIATQGPNTGKGFLMELFKERRELAERVMITRLHLYSIWMKRCDHAEMYKRISKENVEMMRERLFQTVIWPSEDDENAENMDS
ncbi:PREDICTED: chaperonin-like RbcX protein 2, chloroplastic [Ipomoea nil]|uniref:chaperonin-like RbcX protein 2, chloroplastic n=1 Tax=Ipomoea nil TaxID=35883 RepID=UPI000901AF82|nr:PREDICTED: chaperonin-like RbcX protein 2, chloroplastic [Ipomoea nil]